MNMRFLEEMAMRRRAALAACAVLITCGSALAPAPAAAQVLELNGHALSLSKTEMARLGELRQVLHGRSRGVQDKALAAAKSVVNGSDARYVFALYQLEIGMGRRDDALCAEALDVLIPSKDTPAGKMPSYLALRGAIALRARDFATASSAWSRVVEMQPRDPQMLNNLAQLRDAEGDKAAAVELLARAIAAFGSLPQPAPESWYRQRLSIAYNARLAEQGVAAAHALIEAYPTDSNRHYAFVAFRQLAPPREEAEIDLFRLMRVAGALTQPAEYQRFAQLLRVAGLPMEGKAVLDEGLSRNVLSRGQSPTPEILAELERDIARRPAVPTASPAAAAADLRFAEGRFAEAAAAYRSALRPGAADAAALTMRLGMALALAGRRDEAEEAYRGLAAAPSANATVRWYSDLAGLGLALLARPGSDGARAVTR
jgi:Flp pilus assembly protein TadD